MGNKWIDALWPIEMPEADDSHFSIRSIVERRSGIKPAPDATAEQNVSPGPALAPAQALPAGQTPSPIAYLNSASQPHLMPAANNANAPAPRPAPLPDQIQANRNVALAAAAPQNSEAAKPKTDKTNALELAALTRQANNIPRKAVSDTPEANRSAKLPTALRKQYDKSIARLEGHVQGIATALAALDAIDLQLFKARQGINELHARGAPVDYGKVRNVLEAMTQHVHGVVQSLDASEINLLRDSRMKIDFVRTDRNSAEDQSLDLHLISFDSLMKLSRTLGTDPDKIDRFIDTLSRALDGNIQVLSSLMLSLFAARDYTNSVTDLALETNVIKSPQAPVVEKFPKIEPRLQVPQQQQYASAYPGQAAVAPAARYKMN